MPNATFLVTLDLEVIDPIGLDSAKQLLQETIDEQFEVVSVEPWARPSVLSTQPTGVPPIP